MSIAACSAEKNIAKIGSDGLIDTSVGDETHFSLLDVSNIDVTEALTVFVADRRDVGNIANNTEMTPDKALFKMKSDGKIVAVNFSNKEGGIFDDPRAPDKMIQGNGFIVMGFIISTEDEDGESSLPSFETIVVRQSDGATYFVGEDRDLYPGTYRYGINGAASNSVAVSKTGDIFYVSTTERLVRITGFNDNNLDLVERQFVGPASFTADIPTINYQDGLVFIDDAIFLPNQNGTYSISEADLSVDGNASYRVLSSGKQLYAIYIGLAEINPETSLPRLLEDNLHTMTIFTLAINPSTQDVSASLYGTIDTGGNAFTQMGVLGNDGSGSLHSLGNSVFLVTGLGGIVELENETNTPQYVSDISVRKLFETKRYFFIQTEDDTLVRFSEDTTIEDVAGQDKYRNLSVFQDTTGEVIVKGVEKSTASDIIGRIRPEQNDIELIESVPFDAEVTELVRLN